MRVNASIATLIFTICATALIYLPGTKSELHLDSLKLYKLETIYNKHGLNISPDKLKFGDNFGRYVAQFSFYLNIHLSKKLDPVDIKQTNLVIHLACGVLVFIFSLNLVGLTSYSPHKYTLAAISSSLWLLAPMNISSVLYAIQRMTQLSTLFTLVSLNFYILSRQSLRTKTTAVRTYLYVLFAITAFFLAINSKETALLTVAYITLIELLIFNVKPTKKVALFGATSVTLIALVSLQFIELPDYSEKPFTLTERALTQSIVVTEYLRGLLLPSSLEIGIYQDNHTISKSLFNPMSTLYCTALIIISLGACLYFIKHSALFLPVFGILFFFAGHLLESTILPIELYFEHRNYTPGIGLYLALSAATLICANKFGSKFTVPTLCMYITTFAIIDIQKINNWNSPQHALELSANKEPPSGRALSNLAQLHMREGRANEASETIDHLIKAVPNRRFSAILQSLYINCLTETEPKKEMYELLATSKSRHSKIEASQAIANVIYGVETTNCRSIDIHALSNSLLIHSKRNKLSASENWYIDYYIANIYALESTEKAISYLRELGKSGNDKALLYAEDLINGS